MSKQKNPTTVEYHVCRRNLALSRNDLIEWQKIHGSRGFVAIGARSEVTYGIGITIAHARDYIKDMWCSHDLNPNDPIEFISIERVLTNQK